MENLIKRVAKLQGIATPQQIEILESSAQSHMRFSRIDFKILKADQNELIIEVRQGKNPNGNFFDATRLIEIGKEWLQGASISDLKAHFRPIPFVQSPVDSVDSKWILDKMQELKISLKALCADTGVDKTSMSAYVNDLKPLSQTVKAMFYYYFESKSK